MNSSPARRLARLIIACLLAVVATVSTRPAAAHPHVWIEAMSDVVFDSHGRIVAINHEWTMDEMYSETAIDGLDTDGDGTYSPSELEPLTQENIKSLKEFSYFTSMKAGADKVAFRDAAEAGQSWKNKRLTLHFQLPLEKPIDPRNAKVFYRVYDPDFFIAIEFPGKESVFATGDIPGQCKIESRRRFPTSSPKIPAPCSPPKASIGRRRPSKTSAECLRKPLP